MTKTKEELEQLMSECEILNNKLRELSEEELNVVTGGEAVKLKLQTMGGVGHQITIDEPSQPEKQNCQMIACQYTKESCIKKNIGIDNFYCDKFHQFVKDFDFSSSVTNFVLSVESCS